MSASLLLRIALFATILLGLVSVAAPEVSAVTYGEPDCEDNVKCRHPNTLSLSGFIQVEGVGLVSSGRCSGSLLHKDVDKIVILTAGHCVSFYLGGL